MNAVNIIKWFFALVLAIALLANVLAISLLFPVKEVATSPDTFIDAIKKADPYEIIYPRLESMLQEGISEELELELEQQEASEIALAAFSKEWFDGQATKIITQYFEFLNGKNMRPDLAFSLQEPKKKLFQKLSEKFSPQSWQSEKIQALKEKIPDELPLIKEENAKSTLEQHRFFVGIINVFSAGLLAVAALLIIGIIIIVRTRGAFALLGALFLLAAILVFFAGQAVFGVGEKISQDFAIGGEEGDEEGGQNPLKQINFEEILLPVFLALSQKISFFAVVWLFFAIICLAVFLYLRTRKTFFNQS